MADVNVFELTSQILNESRNKKRTSEKTLKESVSTPVKTQAKESIKKIPADKIRLESLKVKEDVTDDTDYTPDDEVVLIVDPEMENEPESEEEAAAAAQELIGSEIHRCPVCGANYIADEEHTHKDEELPVDGLDEDLDGMSDSQEEICPVCQEEIEPTIVGEIAPVGTTEEEPDGDEVPEEPVATEDDEEMVPVDADTKDGDSDEDNNEENDEDDDMEESVERPEGYRVNEVVLNRMLTRFARENYSNIKSVRITSANKVNNRLTLEGVVNTVKGNKRPVKFVCENFVPTQGKILLKLKSVGPFTESAITVRGKVPFVLECVCRGRNITPTMFKYSYSVKEGVDTYKVTGKVLAE